MKTDFIEKLQESPILKRFIQRKLYLSNFEEAIAEVFADLGLEIDEEFKKGFRSLISSAVGDHSLREFLRYADDIGVLSELIEELVEMVNSSTSSLITLKDFYYYSYIEVSPEGPFYEVMKYVREKFELQIAATSEDGIAIPKLGEFLSNLGLLFIPEKLGLKIMSVGEPDKFRFLSTELAGMSDFEGVISDDKITIHYAQRILVYHDKSGFNIMSVSQAMDRILFALALGRITEDNPHLSPDDFTIYLRDFFARYKFDESAIEIITSITDEINVGGSRPMAEFIKARDIGFDASFKDFKIEIWAMITLLLCKING
jgi:hypothetical protein